MSSGDAARTLPACIYMGFDTSMAGEAMVLGVYYM